MKQYTKILALLFLVVFLAKNSNACICSDYLTIDSLAQLKEYDFIAHVKIIDDWDLEDKSNKHVGTIGQLTIQILELFKGEKIDKILEYAKHSSCDIGISKGEEWILFGKKIDGRIAVTACDRNTQYKERDGLRDWKYWRGFYKLEKLKELYGHETKKWETETRKEFYANGKIEIEETYTNGKLNGERRIWYPNGVLFCKQFYNNDTLDGKSIWFYETGQVYDEGYYLKGKHCNVSRLYFDSSEKFISWERTRFLTKNGDSSHLLITKINRVQVHYETVYDNYGQIIISREYTRLGTIHSENTMDPIRNFRTIIYYHENGTISSIGYRLNGKNYGHYQTYNDQGFPDRSWDYDEDGKIIKETKTE